MRLLVSMPLLLLALAACSQEYQRSPLQSGLPRCRVSNLVYMDPLCKESQQEPDQPIYCNKTLGAVECYAQPRPDLAAETRPKVYPSVLADPSPIGSR